MKSSDSDIRKLILASIVCIMFMAIELIGGNNFYNFKESPSVLYLKLLYFEKLLIY
jgi:hypothetical protein